MKIGQFFTPMWVAEALVERHFSQLDAGDLVLEPSCGRGAFLSALPSDVPAIGVEIDPMVAQVAREQTGRHVITGDFRTVRIDVRPTAIIGNPPFVAELIDDFLGRTFEILPAGGRAGFLLPAYMMQTAQRVTRYAERFSIAAEMVPRNVFPRLREPLVFAMFLKDSKRLLIGMALYREATDVNAMPEPYRRAVRTQEGGSWRAVCRLALGRLGGEAELSRIYAEVEGHRQTLTKFWREKIRQTLRIHPSDFRVTGKARYALAVM